MLTKITVSWAYTVGIEVDPKKIEESNYILEIQTRAAQEAVQHVRWKDGMVTNCEAFPQLLE